MSEELRPSQMPPPKVTMRDHVAGFGARMHRFFEHVGAITILTKDTFRALFTKKFEWKLFVYQLEQLGVKSFGIGAATAIFVGIVMAIQFAHSLEKFGAKDSVGRIVGLSETRELAPALTSLVVGSRIGAGMAAQIGSMVVTEQIDAIRSLGADPVHKLVVPRLLASIIIMPLLSCFALVLGVLSAMVVCNLSFGIPMPFFLASAIDQVGLRDFFSGIGKTPFFGFLVAVIGCHFGFITSGGTEGVGKATTSAVVTVSISILVADALLTQIFLSL